MLKVSLLGMNNISRALSDALTQTVKQVADEVLLDARANTPVRTGNARKNWSKKVSNTGFTVENRVPYIERLEAGASKQAPKGIIGPTLTSVKGKV